MFLGGALSLFVNNIVKHDSGLMCGGGAANFLHGGIDRFWNNPKMRFDKKTTFLSCIRFKSRTAIFSSIFCFLIYKVK